ncbi:MAG TPA: ATP-dependent helicase, partial [Candidatus Omnitrophica bacterium]|nr:ATP-dependent helicase [Candidatus Omnitrophota bacterium]
MAHSIDYQKELNSAQLEAVRSTEGPYLVIAGAGSGKTRVLVHRTAYLVERSVRPEEILLLTFTRKASQEMLKRASLILDERCERVSGGTFHSFANMVLRRYANVVGISRDFAILDRSDAEDTVNLIRTKLGFSKTKSRFPRKDALLDILSKSVNKSEPLEKIINGEYSQFAEWLNEIKKIAREYIDYKHSKSILDYDDLLVYLKRLLSGHEDTRLSLSARYRYIMVDEYQDTNKLQSEIVYLLTAENKNIMVVGDDSQSIYSFRGANFRNIIDFPKIFKGTKVITLEENYRSTQPILNLANRIIESSEEGFQKRLYTNKSSSVLPVYIELRDEHRQSEYIVEKI